MQENTDSLGGKKADGVEASEGQREKTRLDKRKSS